MEELFNMVKTYGGKIVSSADLTPGQIATAQACGRFYTDQGGFGFAYVPDQSKYDPPRRSCLWLMCPAEKAIQTAIEEVERIGADARLTDAVIMLTNAKNKVSDFIDKKE